ncbi:MAG: exo-alpha-sialidase, partial [Clostridia bacterium]|nr:exo-alpha-sialidase [Clostridia bacterium]
EGKLTNPVPGGYPRIYALQDGTLLLAVDGMTVYRSTDDGLTWGNGVHASQDYKNTANAALYQTEDGTIYLAFRAPFYEENGAFNSSIQVSYSTDNGYTWEHHSTLYENYEETGVYKGVWEPHFGMMNGKLTCFYANDSTNVTKYQNIEYLQWDEEAQEWGNRTIVYNGEENQSRDGMPVWQQLSTGEYVCVVEAWDKENNDRFCVKLSWSEDGVNWSRPVAVMRPDNKASYCAAPYIVELPTGQILISCQTTEYDVDAGVCQMATCLSDGTSVRYITEDNFFPHDYPTILKESQKKNSSMWNGMYVYKNYIFTCSAGVSINRYEFDESFLEGK